MHGAPEWEYWPIGNICYAGIPLGEQYDIPPRNPFRESLRVFRDGIILRGLCYNKSNNSETLSVLGNASWEDTPVLCWNAVMACVDSFDNGVDRAIVRGCPDGLYKNVRFDLAIVRPSLMDLIDSLEWAFSIPVLLEVRSSSYDQALYEPNLDFRIKEIAWENIYDHKSNDWLFAVLERSNHRGVLDWDYEAALPQGERTYGRLFMWLGMALEKAFAGRVDRVMQRRLKGNAMQRRTRPLAWLDRNGVSLFDIQVYFLLNVYKK